MRLHAPILALLLSSACSPGSGQESRPHARAITTHGRPDLVESSAAAMSVEQPGIFFTINDSGNEPLLFAMDTTGADRGAWRVEGARNLDWESASIGRCATFGAARAAGDSSLAGCVYVGDTGDNEAKRAVRTIYRVREPRARQPGFTGTLGTERLSYRYAIGPRDVEAMYVAPDEAIMLITKRPLRDAAGRPRPSLLFRIDPAAWTRRDTAVAELVDSLSIVPGALPHQITDAALSPDSRYLAVRTYGQIYVFAADSATGRPRELPAPAVCDTREVGQLVGEGITWLGVARTLLLTAEGRDADLWVIDCPLPRAGAQGPGGSMVRGGTGAGGGPAASSAIDAGGMTGAKGP